MLNIVVLNSHFLLVILEICDKVTGKLGGAGVGELELEHFPLKAHIKWKTLLSLVKGCSEYEPCELHR